MKVLGIVLTVMSGLMIGAVLYRALGTETVTDIDTLAAYFAPYAPILVGALALGVFLWTAGVIEQRLTAIRESLDSVRTRLPARKAEAKAATSDTFLF
jgi:Na+-transporting methylmalonyl-CoA/oxaloacetate decarboxylase beta subunit